MVRTGRDGAHADKVIASHRRHVGLPACCDCSLCWVIGLSLPSTSVKYYDYAYSTEEETEAQGDHPARKR